jgi:Cytochrome C assembly protein
MPAAALAGVTHACFGLSYLAAFGFELAGLRRHGRSLRLAGLVFGAAGLIAQTIYLALHRPTPAAPYGSLLLLSWVLGVFYVYGSLHHARQAWAVFVLPVILGLITLSYFFLDPSTDGPTWIAGEKLWGAIHGVLLLLAAVGVSVGFLASVMYLVQSRRLRTKSLGGVSLLSLERLESMNRRAVNVATPLLTAGLLLGGLLLGKEPAIPANLFSLKILGTALLWLACLVLVYLRYAGVPGRRLAWLTIVAFTLMLVVLAAVHPFAEAS